MTGPFPSISAFNQVLSSLTLDAPSDTSDWKRQTLQIAPAQNPDGTWEPGQDLAIWFTSETGISWPSLRKKLAEALALRSHIASDDVCDSILAMFALAAKYRKPASIDLLNLILTSSVPADLTQYFAFHVHGKSSIKFEVDGFLVGPLDMFQLAYRSRKAGSNFVDISSDRLMKLPLSISRLSKVNVIPWETFHNTFIASAGHSSLEQVHILVDRYVHAVADAHFETFIQDFRNAQLLPQALGFSWLSVDALLRLMESERISILLNVEGQNSGWVAPKIQTPIIHLGGPHIGVPYVTSTLQSQYGVLSSNPVDLVIRTYSQFLAEAAEAIPFNRRADAFLYHVIALDILLGEKGSSTASVTKRSALLAHKGLGVSYEDLLNKCDQIYDARSRYVHAGRTPDTTFLPVVEQVTREILLVLFRLKASREYEQETFRNDWVKRVDVLIAKIAANDPISDEEIRRVGVACGNDMNYLLLIDGMPSGFVDQSNED